MKKWLVGASLPWFVAAIAILAFGASFSELQRMRVRFGEVTRHQFHDHKDTRQFMIRAALIGLDRPIIVIGDSITEMARLPETIDGHPMVNAGIGGASIADFSAIAPDLFEHSNAPIIVIALGTNDRGSDVIARDYTSLLSKLKKISPHLIAVGIQQVGADRTNAQIKTAAESEGVAFLDMPQVSTLPDGIHLTGDGSRRWVADIVAAISRTGS